MAVVEYADVEDGALVEWGRVVGVGVREVEIDAELGALAPVLEDLVGDVDGGGLELGLDVLVVGLALEVLEVRADE